MTSHARRRIFLVVTLVLWGLLTHGTYAGTGDEPHYLAIAHSLAFDFDLDLANNDGPSEPLIQGGALEPGGHVRAGRLGIVRPVHDVGMPLLFAPYVRVAAPLVSQVTRHIPDTVMRSLRLTPSVLYRHIVSGGMLALAGVLACLMFDAFVGIGTPPRVAFWTALLVALSPPLLVHSILFFTEVVSALLCIVAFRCVALDRAGSPWQWAVAGTATGLLLLVHVRNAGLVVAFSALALHELGRRRALGELAAFASPLMVLLGVRTAINHHLWGTYVTSPHAASGAWTGWWETSRTAGVRIAGLLLDQEFGLLPYAPVFLIGTFGAVALARTNRALLLRLAVVAGCYLLPVALPITNVHGWTGGWSPPARFIVPIIPLLALAVAAGMRAMPRPLMASIVVVQIGINAYAWQHPKILWNDGDGRAAACSRTGARFCDYLPSFVHRG